MIRLLTIPVLLASLAGVYFAVSFGLADIYAQRGYTQMASWNSENRPNIEDWKFAFDNVAKAAKLAPIHPVYQQRLARLYRQKVTRGLAASEERLLAGEAGIDHLKASLEVRPNWPIAWIEIAYLKWLINERDDEYLQAIRNAHAYGSWEPYVIYFTVILGLQDQANLYANGLRPLLVDSYVRGLRSPVRGTTDFVLDYLKRHDEIQISVVDEILPFVMTDWPRGKSDDFFNVSNFVWPFLTLEEQEELLPRIYQAVDQYRSPRVWLRNTENPELRKTLCTHFSGAESDRRLRRWCRTP